MYKKMPNKEIQKAIDILQEALDKKVEVFRALKEASFIIDSILIENDEIPENEVEEF